MNIDYGTDFFVISIIKLKKIACIFKAQFAFSDPRPGLNKSLKVFQIKDTEMISLTFFFVFPSPFPLMKYIKGKGDFAAHQFLKH